MLPPLAGRLVGSASLRPPGLDDPPHPAGLARRAAHANRGDFVEDSPGHLLDGVESLWVRAQCLGRLRGQPECNLRNVYGDFVHNLDIPSRFCVGQAAGHTRILKAIGPAGEGLGQKLQPGGQFFPRNTSPLAMLQGTTCWPANLDANEEHTVRSCLSSSPRDRRSAICLMSWLHRGKVHMATDNAQ